MMKKYNNRMIDVKKVAKLANLTVNPEEEKKLGKQLEDILKYVEKLNELDTADVIPTSQVTGLQNVTFNDEFSDDCLTQDESISGSPTTHNNMFKVKAVLDK